MDYFIEFLKIDSHIQIIASHKRSPSHYKLPGVGIMFRAHAYCPESMCLGLEPPASACSLFVHSAINGYLA